LVICAASAALFTSLPGTLRKISQAAIFPAELSNAELRPDVRKRRWKEQKHEQAAERLF
jgi:hypothetical protein